MNTVQPNPSDRLNDHPSQPLYHDERGTLRFRCNAIVKHLLDAYPGRLNKLAMLPFEDCDRRQFAQLIGYSLDEYLDLSYVGGVFQRVPWPLPNSLGPTGPSGGPGPFASLGATGEPDTSLVERVATLEWLVAELGRRLEAINPALR